MKKEPPGQLRRDENVRDFGSPWGELYETRHLRLPPWGKLYETLHLRLPPWGKLSTKLTDEG